MIRLSLVKKASSRDCILGIAPEDDLAVLMKDMEEDRGRAGIFKEEGQEFFGEASGGIIRLEMKMEDLCPALIKVLTGLDLVQADFERLFFAVLFGVRFELIDDDPACHEKERLFFKKGRVFFCRPVERDEGDLGCHVLKGPGHILFSVF